MKWLLVGAMLWVTILNVQAQVEIKILRTDSLLVVNNNIKICIGATLTLVAKGYDKLVPTEIFTYQWKSLKDPAFIVNNAKFLVQEDGKYEIVVKAKTTGLLSYDTVTVNYQPREYFTITPTSPVKCINDALVMRATTTGFKNYKWRKLSSSTIINATDSLVNPIANNEYVVSAISPNGCKVDSNIYIVQAPSVFEPKINLGPRDTSLCEGQPLRLKNLLSNKYSHFWSTGSKDSVVTITLPGVYRLTVKTAVCSGADTITLRTAPTPRITLSPNQYACYGKGVKLNITLKGDSVGYNYEWQPALYLDNNKIKSPTANPLGTNNYKVKVFAKGGCFDTASIKVFVNTKINVTVSTKDTLLCGGDSLKLSSSASGGRPFSNPSKYQFQWLPSTEILNAITAAPTVAPTITTRYKLRVTDAASCYDTSSTLVKVYNLKVEISPLTKTNFCLADTIPLKAKITTNSNAYTFKWRSTAPLISDSTTLVTTFYSKVIGENTITAIASDASGCNVRSDLKIRIHQHPIVVSTEKYRRICFGDTARILATANGGSGIDYKFNWFPKNAGLSNAATNKATFAGNNEEVGLKKYFVDVADSYGCKSKLDSVSIETIPFFVANLGGIDTSACNGDSIKLAPLSPIPLTFTYNWINATTGTTVSKNNFIFVKTTGLYQLKVEDAQSGCQNKVLKQVNILNAPSSFSITLSPQRCSGDTLLLIANPVTELSSVKWTTNGSGVTTSPTNDSTVYIANAKESGIVRFTTILENKCGTARRDTNITILTAPPLTITATPSEALVDSLIIFEELTNFSSPLFWNFTDGSPIITGKKVSHSFSAPKQYTVNVHSQTSANGCSARNSIIISILEGKIVTEIYVPNVFAPSSNSYDNKTFKIFGKNISSTDFQFRIYSRWGEILYETKDADAAQLRGWDGTNSTGQPLELGSYTYGVSGKYKNGESFNRSGNVTLLK